MSRAWQGRPCWVKGLIVTAEVILGQKSTQKCGYNLVVGWGGEQVLRSWG